MVVTPEQRHIQTLRDLGSQRTPEEEAEWIKHLLSKDPRTRYRWCDVYALRRLQDRWTREFFGIDAQ